MLAQLTLPPLPAHLGRRTNKDAINFYLPAAMTANGIIKIKGDVHCANTSFLLRYGAILTMPTTESRSSIECMERVQTLRAAQTS